MTNFEVINRLEKIMEEFTKVNPKDGIPYTPEYVLLCVSGELGKLHTELLEEGFKKPEL